MTTKCKSCGAILTIEHLIEPKVGCNIDVCIQCLVAAFEEVLREQKILPMNSESASA